MKSALTLLAATDLSAPARHAVERGFRLAAAIGARYSVLHALELGSITKHVLAESQGDVLVIANVRHDHPDN